MMRCVDQSTLQVSPLVVHKQSLFSSQSLKAESPYVQHCHNFLKFNSSHCGEGNREFG